MRNSLVAHIKGLRTRIQNTATERSDNANVRMLDLVESLLNVYTEETRAQQEKAKEKSQVRRLTFGDLTHLPPPEVNADLNVAIGYDVMSTLLRSQSGPRNRLMAIEDLRNLSISLERILNMFTHYNNNDTLGDLNIYRFASARVQRLLTRIFIFREQAAPNIVRLIDDSLSATKLSTYVNGYEELPYNKEVCRYLSCLLRCDPRLKVISKDIGALIGGALSNAIEEVANEERINICLEVAKRLRTNTGFGKEIDPIIKEVNII